MLAVTRRRVEEGQGDGRCAVGLGPGDTSPCHVTEVFSRDVESESDEAGSEVRLAHPSGD